MHLILMPRHGTVRTTLCYSGKMSSSWSHTTSQRSSNCGRAAKGKVCKYIHCRHVVTYWLIDIAQRNSLENMQKESQSLINESFRTSFLITRDPARVNDLTHMQANVLAIRPSSYTPPSRLPSRRNMESTLSVGLQTSHSLAPTISAMRNWCAGSVMH